MPARSEVRVFDDTTLEFANAMRQISPEIIDLLKGQFNASITALLHGAFKEEENVEYVSSEDESESSQVDMDDSDEDLNDD